MRYHGPVLPVTVFLALDVPLPITASRRV